MKKHISKRTRCSNNIQLLKKMKEERNDFELKELSPVHIRVYGKHLIVDYWPSTEKAWIFQDYHHKAEKMTVDQLIALATG